MKPVSAYVTTQYVKVLKYASIPSCRKALIENDALAVFEDENNSFIGILTPKDVIERPHILVADCLKSRVPVEPDWPVSKVLDLMLEQQANVLPVVSAVNNFHGLIYKRDLMKAIWEKKEQLSTVLSESVKKVEDLSASSALLQEAHNNTDDLQLLVSPAGSIIFHNREVNQYMLTRYQRPLSHTDNIDTIFGGHFGIDPGVFREIFNRALAGEHGFIETEAVTGNDGQGTGINTYKMVCRPVHLQEELKGVAITIKDISLLKTKDKLLNEQKSALKTVMFTESHVIRRPLSNILALVELFDETTLSGNNAELLLLLKTSAEELDKSIKNSTQMLYSTYSKLA